MEFSERFERLRQVLVPSATNPDRMVKSADFGEPVEFFGFLDSQSSVESSSVGREQVQVSATLFVSDLSVDIRRGDRIRSGERLWKVLGFPPAPMNPFTGWRPYREIRLAEVVG
ncbi:hypothetical protein QP426_00645 [Pauljensenia sp. UMB1235]|uniref:hypothetical protein n=1 Tax=Actinomycetaceae TaxID=2049 RepID=UPI00061D518C|nr:MULTISPECIES: hypothetical protein [Actinomycetaceae]MDK7781351.1 hypothetical protein [Actinomycetaceae bacterium UMB8041B]MDK8609091.1 hypothetical protein [Actinomycetaceae bacterium UMB8041A]MDK8753917.1 hypothetical protein [Actinomycetaceae bacterium UMB8039A]CRH93341.1 Uncharacterised protein [Chlamydia trachomatis]MDK6399569.1 hypothetical protein [Pauljensenia sp. UMB9872]